MKSHAALLALCLLGLPGPLPARAGSAEPGGVRSGTLTPETTPLVRRLTGQWQLVAFESGGKPMPVPGSIRYLLHLGADGTATMEMGQPTPRKQVIGRWRVKGKHLEMITKTKTELVEFHLAGDQLTITTPSPSSKTRLVLRRWKPAPRP